MAEPAAPESDKGYPDDDAERRRRERADLLLGEVLPGVTTDETATGWSERGASSRDDQILRDVPPHHGG